jgi:hypothetical protein
MILKQPHQHLHSHRPKGTSGNRVNSAGSLKKELAKKEHDRYDSRHEYSPSVQRLESLDPSQLIIGDD